MKTEKYTQLDLDLIEVVSKIIGAMNVGSEQKGEGKGQQCKINTNHVKCVRVGKKKEVFNSLKFKKIL